MQKKSSVRIRWKFLAAIVATCLTLGALEVAARSFITAKQVPRARLLLDTGLGLYAPHPYLGYIPRPGYRRPKYRDGTVSINSKGFRGPEFKSERPDGSCRIVCLGGSTTFSTRVGDETTYPRLLEKQLQSTFPETNIEVINAGTGGYTSAESLINLQLRVLDLKPDLIIVYHAVNDIHPRVVPGFTADYSHYRKAFNPPERSFSDTVAEWSTLYACLRYRFLVERRNSLIRMTTRVPSFTLPIDVQAASFAKTTPDTFRRNIHAIVDCATDNDIGVVLSTFTYCRSLHETKYTNYDSASYYRGFEQHNTVMTEISRDEGLIIADVAKEFPSQDESLFSGPVHLNSRGTQVKAQIIHDAIVRGRIIGRTAKSRTGMIE